MQASPNHLFPRLLPVALAVGTVCGLASVSAQASSHREAPAITHSPKVDGTDLYLFRSYETGRSGFVTAIANYQPFQDPQGGPNFYQFDPHALYEIHFDSNGDAIEDLTFQFRFTNTLKSTALTIGPAGNQKSVPIPLIQSSTISGMNPPSLNVREQFTVDVVRGDRRSGTRSGKLSNASGGATTFDKPVDNIGDKTFGGPSGYEAYANQHIYTVNIPGCESQGPGRVFVGQRKEPFFIAVGKIFDLINLNPTGAETDGNKNDLESKNISTLALELPIGCVAPAATTTKTEKGDPVIGAWTTASQRQGRLLNGSPKSGMNNASTNGGAWTQVSRLGMPLVNEVVVGIPDKDRFNAGKPPGDGALIDYVTHPTLPALIETLFPSAKAPTKFPRSDLVAAFLTGIAGVNQPVGVKASEMMRLNTSTPVTPVASQNPLGVAADDFAGFPNGRRPGDDVVDVALRVAMGALCVKTTDADSLKVGCKPSDAPAGSAALTDGVRRNANTFRTTFPYLNTPIPGNFNN